jgi:hypothetical protein
MWHELIFLNFYNYFLIENDDVECVHSACLIINYVFLKKL